MLDIFLNKLVGFAISTGTKLLGDRLRKINDELEEKSRRNSQLRPLNVEVLRRDVLERISRTDLQLRVAEPQVIRLLADHISFVRQWAQDVTFRDLKVSKSLVSSYIELDTYVMPRDTHFDSSERQQKRQLLSTLLSSDSHNVVLGVPGAGKTTSMKKLCSMFCNGTDIKQPYSIPLLIRFRALSSASAANPLRSAIISLIPFKLSIDGDIVDPAAVLDMTEDAAEINCVASEAYTCLLDGLNALLILDGFDEIADWDVKRRVLDEIRFLSSRNSSRASGTLPCFRRSLSR